MILALAMPIFSGALHEASVIVMVGVLVSALFNDLAENL